jgi:hypothetical protein
VPGADCGCTCAQYGKKGKKALKDAKDAKEAEKRRSLKGKGRDEDGKDKKLRPKAAPTKRKMMQMSEFAAF